MLAPDAEELVISYLRVNNLAPAIQIGTEMPPTPTYPFYLVTRLPDTGDDMVTDYPCLSIHAFASTREAARDAARQMHKLMKNLTPKVPVLMGDGSYSSIDYLEVTETPAWRDYGDKTIRRYCGRYHIDLRVNRTT